MIEPDVALLAETLDSVMIKKAPVPDLPLSQELKDKIYLYLLDANAVEYTPACKAPSHSKAYTQYGGSAHIYRFYTEMVRVNKTIGAQAKQILLENNTFVLVRYNARGLQSQLHAFQIPVVADRHLEHFQIHSFELDLTWTSSPWEHMYAEVASAVCPPDRGHFLLLEKDMPKFCDLISLACHYTWPSRTYVSSRNGIMPQLDDFGAGRRLANSPAIHVSVHNNGIHESSPEHKCKFLETWRNVTGAGCNASFTGFNKKLSKDVKRAMFPQIIWVRALEWDRLDTLLRYKRNADRLAAAVEHVAAACMYDYLHCYYWATDLVRVPRQTDGGIDPDRHAAGLRWAFAGFDLCMANAWLALRRSDYEDAEVMLEGIDASMMLLVATDRMIARFKHLKALIELMALPNGSSISATVLGIARTMARLGSLCQDEYISHDIKMLNMGIKFPSSLNLDTFWDMLSINALPFPNLDSQAECPQLPRPEGLVGWQDVKHLAALTDADKKYIRDWQKKEGLALSNF